MLGAAFRSQNGPDAESLNLGFRLAMVPEPSTGLLVIAGLLGLSARTRFAKFPEHSRGVAPRRA
jgi:PEP-CTERM putative exosortase interaction domain